MWVWCSWQHRSLPNSCHQFESDYPLHLILRKKGDRIMSRIKKIEQGQVKFFKTIKEASNSINIKIDSWKVQLLIADAIKNKKKAFGAFWKRIN